MDIPKRKSISLGVYFETFGSYEKALIYLEKALDYFKTHKNDYEIGISYNLISSVKTKLEDFSGALDYVKKAYSVAKNNNDIHSTAFSLRNFIRIYYNQEKYKNHMEQTLEALGWSVDSSIRRELVRVLKEKACFVSLDYNEDLKHSEQYEKEYSLPDGSTISLNKERFIVPELLFKPSSELEEDALHVAIMDVIEACDVDIRPTLLNDIFLSGGSSMFPNLESRIYQELELELVRRKKKKQVIRIIAPTKRLFSVWIGGSNLAMNL